MGKYVAEQWRQIILPFTSAHRFDNPFLDARLCARFTGPSGRVIEREAYWDGGDSYKVAFAPTEPGEWRWRLSAPKETGLDGASGAVECVPYAGEHAIYRHGFLRVSQNRRYLEHADGTPFFWLGDTHWAFAYGERWDESNHPAMDSMFRGMVDRRVQQGYTVYQTNLRSDETSADGGGAGDSLYWDKSCKDDVPNVTFYQNELDRRMLYIADSGLVNALGLAWFSAVQNGTQHMKHLARYIIARYGALPIVWTLAGEAAGYFPGPPRERFIRGWREVALYIEQTDGYDHLQSAHSTNERPFADYYHADGWHDFTMNQAGHGDYPVNAHWYRRFHAEHTTKPFIESESLYEFVSTLEENGSRLCTPYMVRRAAYLAMQTGACGYTYGAQGIWDNLWEPHDENLIGGGFNRFGIPWYKAIDGEAGEQMGILRRFYEENRFWELIPHNEEEVATANPFDARAPLASATADSARWVLYYTENITWRQARITGFCAAPYVGTWVDPRTGEKRPAGEYVPEDGALVMPKRPTIEDWLLVLEKRA